MNPRRIRAFRRRILNWYRAHKQNLPWRHSRDPYKILVSEVMLQQTQVDRVRQKWPEFFKAFPTVKELAAAPVADVIRAWRGMGYNRRALYLQRTARAVMERFGGKFPQTLEELRTLPGVGEYTARALLVFAFGKCYIAPDVNVLRILKRSFGSNSQYPIFNIQYRNRLIALGDQLVTPINSYDLNQALMDLGRTICTAKNPKDELCPLHRRHPSLSDGSVTKRRARLEPMFAGVPRRIWRGRIVELVRARGSVARHRIQDHLGIGSEPESRTWLDAVLSQLHREGLLTVSPSVVTLPS